MRIGIDARMSGPNVGGGGLGRYVEQLLKELPSIDTENRYVLFKPDIPWYTLKEQLTLPRIIDREQLDLIHFPHWNVPMFLKTPFVVTIHDLILLNEPRSARATTRHPLVYAIKYYGFRRVLAHAIRASKKIIAVSEATKKDILKFFPYVQENKIVVIYEGVTSLPSLLATRYSSSFLSLLYVGNCYPHKNLDTLLRAFDLLHASIPNVHLTLAGREDEFFQRLQKNAQHHLSAPFIHFEKNPTDEKLAKLYRNATAFIFPSRIEGFGLPPLEAMNVNLPVAASDIQSLHEVLGDAAIYFPSTDPTVMAEMLTKLLRDESLRKNLIQKGREQIKRYSWKKMAEETVKVYESCANT